VLRFFWTRKGRWVRFSGVSHPGMDGTPYLTAPLLFIGVSRGYRVIIA
jgi:hypothetical protein